jgi:hypothetical protein
LQYLAEADYFEMSDHGFNDNVRATLAQLSPNRILREQYLDFLKCRRFRQTLLCHCERPLSLEMKEEKIADLLVSSMARCANDQADLGPGIRQVYETPKRACCETDFSLGKASLEILGRIWPAPLPFAELSAEAAARLREAGLAGEATESGRERLRGFLARLYSAGVVELRSIMPAMARGVSDRPLASPVARWQAARGKMLTTAFHLSVQVDETGRNLILWLDGTLNRAQLLDKLWQWFQSKDALGPCGDDGTTARKKIAAELDENLANLARLGLLVG